MPDEKKPEYPNAKIAFEEIKSEYEMENERENKIASKSSAFITVIIAVVALFIPLVPFDRLKNFFSNIQNTEEKWIVIVSLFLLVGGLAVLMVAFGFFIKAYSVKGYNRVEVDDLMQIANQQENADPESQIYQGLVAHYHKTLRGTMDKAGNMKINTESASSNRSGIVLTVVGFAIISVSTIALRILVV